MPSVRVVRSVNIVRTPRVVQVEGIFQHPPTEKSELVWDANLPIEERPWNIGLIVGPSGAGKTTVARAIFGDRVITGFEWPEDKSILDAFPHGMSIRDITALLASVGLASVPAWMRPFRVLSTGEQFRANLARALAEAGDEIVVFDEYTSVVDRTVAQIASAALAKTVRRRNQRFVAVTCHYDVEEWLQPDWVYQPHVNQFTWRCLQRRPPIELEIARVHHSAWQLFRPHHYLSHTFNPSARCFVAFWQGIPVALQAVIKFPHPHAKNVYRGHRAVCLPDYQGVGIGNALITYVARAYRGIGARIFSITASPALNHHRARSPEWRLLRAPSLVNPRGPTTTLGKYRPSANRMTATWEYVGPPLPREEAEMLIYGERVSL